jgi:hypothetical protein
MLRATICVVLFALPCTDAGRGIPASGLPKASPDGSFEFASHGVVTVVEPEPNGASPPLNLAGTMGSGGNVLQAADKSLGNITVAPEPPISFGVPKGPSSAGLDTSLLPCGLTSPCEGGVSTSLKSGDAPEEGSNRSNGEGTAYGLAQEESSSGARNTNVPRVVTGTASTAVVRTSAEIRPETPAARRLRRR